MSIECLLSLIEFVHFEKFLVDHAELSEVALEGLWCIEDTLSFPESIPKSRIVCGAGALFQDLDFNADGVDHVYYKIAHDLWAKYVAVGSELEINISSSLRRRAMNMINAEPQHCRMEQLLGLFNELCNSQVLLMKDSFIRFQDEDRFKNLQNLIFL